jgi:hypothetical protein
MAGETVIRDRHHLDQLWEEARAAIIVRWRVDTPEVRQEARRAIDALVSAMLRDDEIASALGEE